MCVCLTGVQLADLASCRSVQSSLSGGVQVRAAAPIRLRCLLSELEFNFSVSVCRYFL